MGHDAQIVSEVMRRQRACREFSAEPVDDDVITELLAAAIRAPSGENRQPWQFVVVTDDAQRGAIWSIARRAWETGGRDNALATLTPQHHAEVDRSLTSGFAGAPVTVVVGADLDRCWPETIGSSIFPAVQNLLVAATAHGLGSALTTIATIFADELSAVVGFPKNVVPVVVIPVGHPARPLGPSRREPISEHAHRETWGRPWRAEPDR
jgi:nitroreductase